MSRALLFIFVAVLYNFVFPSCTSFYRKVNIYKVHAEEGYISFKIRIDKTKLYRLRDDLSFGSRDTCFLYYNMRVFKDLTLGFDSLSYSCLNNKKLDSEKLEKFSRTLKPRIVDKNNALIAFEPYDCALQFSLEVGQEQENRINNIFIGYSKSFDSSR